MTKNATIHRPERKRIKDDNLTQWRRASCIVKENVSISCSGTNNVCLPTDNHQAYKYSHNTPWPLWVFVRKPKIGSDSVFKN